VNLSGSQADDRLGVHAGGMADDEVSGTPGEESSTTPMPADEPIRSEAAPAAAAPVGAAPVLKTRWRDRAWTFRAMLAVAAASLVIGGIAGGVIVGAASDDDRGDHRMDHMGRWYRDGGVPPGWQRHGPRNFQGPGQGPGGGPAGPMMPYGDGDDGATPTPPAATPTPTPGATG